MANYNANAMAAYKQYGQTMMAGGGGSNMSGTGSSTMQVFNAMRDDDDKPSGLAAKPTTTKDKKPSFWDRITSVFQENEVDVTNVYKPSVDPSNVYTQKMFEMVPSASDYVYRAEMSDQTQDMVEQAMGYEVPKLGQLQMIGEGPMSGEEKEQFAPLIKLADDIRNGNITSTALPSVLSNNQIRDLAFKAIEKGTFSRNNVEDDIVYQKLLTAITEGTNPLLDEEGNVVQGEPYTLDEEASLMDALMEGQPTEGLMARPSSFTGGSVQVASNIPNWMQDMSAGELKDALVGIRLGTVDPETGQTIQSAEDVEEANSFTESQPQDSILGGLFDYIPDAFQVSNYLTGGDQLDGSKKTGLMSQRLDGKDGDLAASVAPFSVSEDELYNFAKEAYPDNDLAAGALLATIEAESASGNTMLESGNYSKKAALAAANQGEFKTARKREVEKIFKDPNLTYVDSNGVTRMTKEGRVKFFNIYYNDKYRGEDYKLGNTEEGDGFRFRGRGPIQLTGRKNYKQIGDMIGVDLVQNPQLIVTDKDVALAATKAFMELKGLNKAKSAKDLHDIVGHKDDKKLTKAKARWKRAQEIQRRIMRETSPRPMLRPE